MERKMDLPPLIWEGDEPHQLSHSDFPKSSRYHPEWVFRCQMGPNVLWLSELLADAMDLRPGMRVLDMGCGRALSSIFLAKEFGVEVYANDLWIDPSDNYRRIKAAGMEDQVIPIKAEAHSLPYAEEFFDAAFSVDAYHYFGTDQIYLGYFARFLKIGAQLGIVVPGLHQRWSETVPSYFTQEQSHGGVFWAWDMASFQTAAWWRELWSQYPFFRLQRCEALPQGGELWLEWERRFASYPGDKLFPADVEALEADQNRFLTFVLAIGQRTDYAF